MALQANNLQHQSKLIKITGQCRKSQLRTQMPPTQIFEQLILKLIFQVPERLIGANRSMQYSGCCINSPSLGSCPITVKCNCYGACQWGPIVANNMLTSPIQVYFFSVDHLLTCLTNINQSYIQQNLHFWLVQLNTGIPFSD